MTFRGLARATTDADQARRLLALATIYDGGTRSEAATVGHVTLQIVRDLGVRFNARGSYGLITGRAPGSRPKLGEMERQALAPDGGEWPDPGDPWRGALASQGSRGLDLRDIRYLAR